MLPGWRLTRPGSRLGGENVDSVLCILYIKLSLALLFFSFFAGSHHNLDDAGDEADRLHAHRDVERAHLLVDLVLTFAVGQEHVVVGLHHGENGEK